MLYYITFVSSYLLFSFIAFCMDYFTGKKCGQYLEILPTVLFNVIILNIPFFQVYSTFVSNSARSLLLAPAEFLVMFILSDILFYSGHRLLHTHYLYRYVHYVHHRLKYTIGLGSLYSHPVDWFITHLSGMIPPVILRASTQVTIYWILTVNFVGIFIAHGGYLGSDHEMHHIDPRYNFGNGVLDYIFSTRKPDGLSS